MDSVSSSSLITVFESTINNATIITETMSSPDLQVAFQLTARLQDHIVSILTRLNSLLAQSCGSQVARLSARHLSLGTNFSTNFPLLSQCETNNNHCINPNVSQIKPLHLLLNNGPTNVSSGSVLSASPISTSPPTSKTRQDSGLTLQSFHLQSQDKLLSSSRQQKVTLLQNKDNSRKISQNLPTLTSPKFLIQVPSESALKLQESTIKKQNDIPKSLALCSNVALSINAKKSGSIFKRKPPRLRRSTFISYDKSIKSSSTPICFETTSSGGINFSNHPTSVSNNALSSTTSLSSRRPIPVSVETYFSPTSTKQEEPSSMSVTTASSSTDILHDTHLSNTNQTKNKLGHIPASKKKKILSHEAASAMVHNYRSSLPRWKHDDSKHCSKCGIDFPDVLAFVSHIKDVHAIQLGEEPSIQLCGLRARQSGSDKASSSTYPLPPSSVSSTTPTLHSSSSAKNGNILSHNSATPSSHSKTGGDDVSRSRTPQNPTALEVTSTAGSTDLRGWNIVCSSCNSFGFPSLPDFHYHITTSCSHANPNIELNPVFQCKKCLLIENSSTLKTHQLSRCSAAGTSESISLSRNTASVRQHDVIHLVDDDEIEATNELKEECFSVDCYEMKADDIV